MLVQKLSNIGNTCNFELVYGRIRRAYECTIMNAVKVFNRLNTAETVYSRICDLLIWIL